MGPWAISDMWRKEQVPTASLLATAIASAITTFAQRMKASDAAYQDDVRRG